jgi:arylsulfatase A-like enzyme
MFKYFITSFSFIFICFSIKAQSKSWQPDIIVILADNLGWANPSSYGSTFYETLHLDKLASN